MTYHPVFHCKTHPGFFGCTRSQASGPSQHCLLKCLVQHMASVGALMLERPSKDIQKTSLHISYILKTHPRLTPEVYLFNGRLCGYKLVFKGFSILPDSRDSCLSRGIALEATEVKDGRDLCLIQLTLISC